MPRLLFWVLLGRQLCLDKTRGSPGEPDMLLQGQKHLFTIGNHPDAADNGHVRATFGRVTRRDE